MKKICSHLKKISWYRNEKVSNGIKILNSSNMVVQVYIKVTKIKIQINSKKKKKCYNRLLKLRINRL